MHMKHPAKDQVPCVELSAQALSASTSVKGDLTLQLWPTVTVGCCLVRRKLIMV